MKKIKFPWAYLLLLIPLLEILPNFSKIPFAQQAQYSDLLVSHLPNAIWINHAVTRFGQIPLWSSLILGGAPFAADPLSGLWYPPLWLAAAIPSVTTFNLLVMAHLLISGLGMAFLLRKLGVAEFPAILSGLFFELFPKLWGNFAAGHVTLLFAVSWTPLLIGLEIAYRGKASRKLFTASLLVYAIILLADLRWAVYAGLLWGAVALITARQSFRDFGRSVLRLAARVILAVLLAAPFLLPLLELIGLSTRATMGSKDTTALSLPLKNLIGLIFPSFNISPEWVIYPGAAALFALILCPAIKDLRRRTIGWVVLALAGLLLSLGSLLPGYSFLASFPPFSLLRVPARAIILFGFALAVLLGMLVDYLIHFKERDKFDPMFFVFGCTFLILLMSGGVYVVTGSISREALWGGGSAVVFCLLYLLRTRKWVPVVPWLVIFTIALSIDLFGSNFQLVQYKSVSEVEDLPAAIIHRLDEAEGVFRIYSPSYSIPQDLAARHDWQLADGVNPMQLAAYVNYMQTATGVLAEGYSVTLPAFAGGDPRVDNRDANPDAGLLGKFNVRFVVSSFPIEEEDFVAVMQEGGIYLYENTEWAARACLISEGSTTPVALSLVTANRIEASVTGPGELMLAENCYPGWKATVDGVQQPLNCVDGVFRSVSIGDGVHAVRFEYWPALLFIGIGLSVISIVFLFAFNGNLMRRGYGKE